MRWDFLSIPIFRDASEIMADSLVLFGDTEPSVGIQLPSPSSPILQNGDLMRKQFIAVNLENGLARGYGWAVWDVINCESVEDGLSYRDATKLANELNNTFAGRIAP